MYASKLVIIRDLIDELLFGEEWELSFLRLSSIDIERVIIPYVDVMIDEKADIRVTAQEPEELRHDSFPVDLLGREKWESISEVKSELTAKEAIIDISRTIINTSDPLLDKFSTKIEVLLFWMMRHGEIS